MIENIFAIVGVVVIVIALTPIIFRDVTCPHCGGKLIDNDYDTNINKVVLDL